MRPSPFRNLDPAHARAVGLVGVAAYILAIACLELLRLRAAHDLAAAGFLPWGNAGFFVHDIPGQSLALTSLQPQLFLLLAALPVAIAAAMLCGAAALADMHMPFATISAATMPLFLLLPLTGLLIYLVLQPQPCLTINIAQGIISVTPGNTDFEIADLAQFQTYWTGSGKNTHLELGAVLNSGAEFGLLPLPTSFSNYNDAYSQHLIASLQEFINTNGLIFPAS